MSNIYDISETPEKLKLKEQLLTKLHNNNKHSNLFEELIQKYSELKMKYNQKLEQMNQLEEQSSLVLLKDENNDEEEKEISILRNLFNHLYVNENLDQQKQIYIKAIQITDKENRNILPENEILKEKCIALENRMNELNSISQTFAREIFKLKQENKQITKENLKLKQSLPSK